MEVQNLVGRTQFEFKFIQQIGKGSYGHVYEAQYLPTKKLFAVKVQSNNTINPQLQFQFQAYKYLKNQTKQEDKLKMLPKIHGFFINKQLRIMVMDRCGQNLATYFKQCDRNLSLQQILRLTHKMINCIQVLHQASLVHRDIKPQNFVLSLSDPSTILLLDLGLSKKLLKNQQLISQKSTPYLIGTLRYASINAHQRRSLGKRDDLESIGYVLIQLISGKLPWQSKDKEQDGNSKVLDKKKRLGVEQLCVGLPKGVQMFMKYVSKLDFCQNPDYQYLHRCIESCLTQIQKQNQFQFGPVFIKNSFIDQISTIGQSSKQKQSQIKSHFEQKISIKRAYPSSKPICSSQKKALSYKKKFIIQQNEQPSQQSQQQSCQKPDKFLI